MRRTIRIACASLWLAATFGQAWAQLPDTPDGRRGNALIGMLRGGPDSVTEAIMEENFAPSYFEGSSVEQRAATLRSTVSELGSVALEGAEKTGPFSITLVGSAGATGERLEIAFEIEESPPHRITRLDLERSAPLPPMTIDEMRTAADETLSRATETGEFSGVALVARGEEVVFQQAYGLANRRYQAPNRLDTAFNLGSIDKIFTKVALAQLAAAGKLSFDDTVAEHLPDYPNQEVARRITLQQVVTHTAGLGDIFTEAFAAASKRSFREPRDYFRLFADDALLFEPGDGEQYSNGGYIVLGAVIEAVSGQRYADYVRENIFEPAGMTHTRAWALDDPEAPIATGYTRMAADHGSGTLHENTFHIPHSGTPAGGGYSTAADLLAFRQALASGVLLDPRYLEWLLSNRLPEVEPTGPVALGLGIAGGAPGVNAALEMSDEWTVVVLTNLDPPSAGEASAQLRRLIGAVERGEP